MCLIHYKEPAHKIHLFRNLTILVALYDSESVKRTVHKNNLFGNAITVVVLYVFDSQKKKQLIRIICSGIRLHCSHCIV